MEKILAVYVIVPCRLLYNTANKIFVERLKKRIQNNTRMYSERLTTTHLV